MPDTDNAIEQLLERAGPRLEPPVDVRERFTVMPRLEAVAVYKGERPCTNDDLIRNAAYCWSPMTVEEISRKTGYKWLGRWSSLGLAGLEDQSPRPLNSPRKRGRPLPRTSPKPPPPMRSPRSP